jgi:hypothetical protein
MKGRSDVPSLKLEQLKKIAMDGEEKEVKAGPFDSDTNRASDTGWQTQTTSDTSDRNSSDFSDLKYFLVNVKQYFISRGFGGETLGECERAALQQALFAERKHAVVAEMNAAQALHKYNVSRKALAAAMVKPLSIDFPRLSVAP